MAITGNVVGVVRGAGVVVTLGGAGVVVVVGDKRVGEARGAGVVDVVGGNGVGGVTDGAGAGTTPSLLSMQKPSRSNPTQSPTNRFEQSKNGKNSVSVIT